MITIGTSSGVATTRRSRRLLLRGLLTMLGLAPIAAEGAAHAGYACSTAPSAAVCKDDVYRESCPGRKEQCRPILQSGFKSAWSGAQSRERYQDLDDTQPIVAGLTQKRIIDSASLLLQGGFASYEGMEQRNKALAMRDTVAVSPGYTRAPSWLSSPSITSCSEYVYEKYYDYMRFVDAANSCKGDAGCVVDMAYYELELYGQKVATAPNIASRPLAGRSTQRVPLPPIPLTQGVVPKNAFYNGVVFLPPSLRDQIRAVYPGWGATLDNVAARAYAGTNYYRWGSNEAYGGPAPVHTYATEFDYHKAMRALTRNVPVPEAAANQSRLHDFEERFASFALEAYCHGLSGAVECVEAPKIRKHGVLETIGGDPWVRSHVLADRSLRQQAMTFALQGTPIRLDGTGSTLLTLESVIDTGMPSLPGGQVGGIGGIGTTTTTNVINGGNLPTPTNEDPALDPSPVWSSNNPIGIDLHNEWAAHPPTFDASSPVPRLNCAAEAETSTYRLLACEATNAVLDEITRENGGCFDTNYKGCDWHPSMFVSRFLETQQYMAERVHDYNQCNRWTLNNFTTIVPSSAKESFEALEDFFDKRRAAMKNFPAPRVMGPDGHVASFGESQSDSITMGDQGSFGGGYSYLAGWSSRPVKPKSDGSICRMDFAADATFAAWASAFEQTFDLLNAAAYVRVNENDNGTATFTRSFKVFGVELLPSAGTTDINYASDVVDESKEWSKGYSQTIVLPYGFTVTIGGGVEVAAGVEFSANALTPRKSQQSCTNTQALAAEAALTPYARASGYLTASGGWMGIVEAGLEAELDFIRAELPVKATGGVSPGETPKLKFELSGNLTLHTLSGRVDACGCFLGFCGCREVASWPGVDLGTVELFEPINAEADLTLF